MRRRFPLWPIAGCRARSRDRTCPAVTAECSYCSRVSGDDGTPAERLLYALGQLYRLHRAGELPVEPRDFDVLDLARIIGVSRHIEFVAESSQGTSYHFAREVLVLDRAAEFPWKVLDQVTWAVLEEFAEDDSAESSEGSRGFDV